MIETSIAELYTHMYVSQSVKMVWIGIANTIEYDVLVMI